MNKTFKIALSALALAGFVSAADIAPVSANDEEAHVIELQDGSHVKVEGDHVMVVDENGETQPAPDGEHVTKDGETIVTKDGKIVE